MMAASDDTRQFWAETLKAERALGTTRTRADSPARPVDAEFWRDARAAMPSPGRASVHLRLDADVLECLPAEDKDI